MLTLVLISVAIIATSIPAIRATKVDPFYRYDTSEKFGTFPVESCNYI